MKLDDLPIPEGSEERAWQIVRAAFEERTPAPRERHLLRPVLVVAVVAAAAGVLASPPGRALISSVREAVGVKKAEPALFSLPASGRLLVVSERGPWVVQPNGSKRLLGHYRDASWSPFGRYIAATQTNELLALDPKGNVRWTLARRDARFPRWTGTRTDTRIAYVSGHVPRIVAGDSTGDRAGCAHVVARVAPAWRPGPRRVLALAFPTGAVYVFDADGCRLLWHTQAGGMVPNKLEWSSDGRLLLAFAPHAVRVYDGHGHVVAQDDPSDATIDADATFIPHTHVVAAIRVHGTQSDVFLLRPYRLVFRGTGVFRQVAASPNGRWLLFTWPTADQWVFVRVAGARRIVAVSGITRQFGGEGFPRIAGWCCAH